jgi:hypothetical protein
MAPAAIASEGNGARRWRAVLRTAVGGMGGDGAGRRLGFAGAMCNSPAGSALDGEMLTHG